jgi:predicted acylesterase/phospholipase RssA
MSVSSALLKQVRALVFAGGGVRGLAFVGALQYLRDESGVDFGARVPPVTDVAGVSIGTVFALMIACGYTVAEMTDVGAALRHSDMVDADPVRLFSGELSIDDGGKLRAFTTSLLSRKGFAADVTFSQLKELTGVSLHVVVTDITNASVVHVSPDSTHASMSVVSAMVASMSLPLLFPPVTAPNGHLWADGGLMENFPIMLFPPEHVLGFTFRWSMDRKADTMISYITRVIHVAQVPLEMTAWALMSRAHRARCVVVDTGSLSTLGATVTSTELTREDRLALLHAGGAAVAAKMRQWDAGVELDMDPSYLLGGERMLPTFLGSLVTCAPTDKAQGGYLPTRF